MSKKTKILIGILTVPVILYLAFLIYASDYYQADAIAQDILETNSQIEQIDSLTILHSKSPTDTAIIFYPGAKVEAIAYLPLLDQLRNQGLTCVLIEMPYNMAIFNSNAAENVFDLLPEIKNWYISGHSMGGAMASKFASDHPDRVKGLILMGAYIYGDYPPEKALTIYGSFNSNLEENINYTENIVIIDGGNHAKFGNYGIQKGDPIGSISHEEQQQQTVDAILKFIQ